MLALSHLRQIGVCFLAQFAGIGGGKQRKGIIVGQAAHGPQRFAPVHAQ